VWGQPGWQKQTLLVADVPGGATSPPDRDDASGRSICVTALRHMCSVTPHRPLEHVSPICLMHGWHLQGQMSEQTGAMRTAPALQGRRSGDLEVATGSRWDLGTMLGSATPCH